MVRLRCCDGCMRHVRSDEPVCPFCRRALASASARPRPRLPSGLSRTQRLALAAAMSGQALSACAEVTQGESPAAGSVASVDSAGKGASSGAAGSGVQSATAGKSAGPTAGKGSNIGATAGAVAAMSAQSGSNSIMVAPPYGGPPPPPRDAGTPDRDASSADDDAGTPLDAGRVHPVYGAPLPR
jgi:hypothetical protein